ncbi:hypothetical protein MMC07_004677 [Pseudocyphellaria aurata]|nr:hypothetical protein [Pseudocyphellaria aurata]
MAFIAFLIASLAAIFTSLLTFSPTGFRGLAPWIDRLSTAPSTPTPSTVFAPELWDWEVIPTANLSALDVVSPLLTRPFTFLPDEDEDDKPRYVVPPPDEPTAEEPLRELWWLLKQAVLCITIDVGEFLRSNPCLWWEKPKLRRWRVYRRLTSLSRHRLRGRAQRRTSPRSRFAAPVPSVPAPAPLPPTPPPSSPLLSRPSSPSASERALLEELRVQRERNIELENQVGSLNSQINELLALELDYIAELRANSLAGR